jgi:hypothetical protein
MHFLNKIKKSFRFIFEKDTIRELTKCDGLLICHDDDRGDYKFGLPYSKYLDSVFEDLNSKGYLCKQFAPPLSFYIGKKAWAEPYSGNRTFIIVYVIGKIKNIFNLILNRNLLPSNFAHHFIYRKALEKSRPSFIIVIGASAALCKAANTLNIPVLELLHGMGYDRIYWGWDKAPVENLPTHILSTDATSTKTFSPLTSKGIKIIEIPHPWYKRFIKEAVKCNLDNKWLEKPKILPSNKKIILVSISWGYDGDHSPIDYFYQDILPNGLLPLGLIKVIMQTQNDVFWCLRRHPVQVYNDKYDKQITFLNSITREYQNCEWSESTSSTLISLLSHCDGHITMNSMTSYDAACMGVKSLLLCPTLKVGRENQYLFNDLVKDGYSEKGNFDEDSIAKWVKNVKKTIPFSYTSDNQTELSSLLLNLSNVALIL